MDPTATRTLGRTGVPLTQLGFGSAPLGELYAEVPEATAQATIGAAWDGGIRMFDTAPWYGRGLSEHRIGHALRQHPRGEFVLSTKVGRVLRASRDEARFDRGMWKGGLPFPERFDYSYDGLMRSYEDSTQRLGLARIDLLLIHDLDLQYHGVEAGVAAHLAQLFASGWRALLELKEAGLVRGVGAGINEAAMIPRFLDLLPLDFFLVALPYTLLDQEVLDGEFPRCADAGVGVVVGAVFASGVLATGPVPGAKYRYADLTPEVAEKVRRIEAVCARHATPVGRRGAAVPARPRLRRLGDPRGDRRRAGGPQRRHLPPRHPRGSLGRTEA